MTFWELAFVVASCALANNPPAACLEPTLPAPAVTAPSTATEPIFSGSAVDVVLSAKAALAWDMASGTKLYGSEVTARRPIASITKLLSVLVIREHVPLSTTIEIPPDVRAIQRRGAHIGLIPGQHAAATDLLSASLIASANDAITALAIAAAGSSEDFVTRANTYAGQHGFPDTKLSNSTGLQNGEQYSTAQDVQRMLMQAYADPVLRDYLAAPRGSFTTQEGKRHSYLSTNKLLQTYVPILAAKTGFTNEAGENLAIITEGPNGQRIGAVILGSEDRFQDMKVLVEWIWRNYTWP
jgi:D-alanyl-D-alanine carboxypeptidase (penicillin-binding protein 5/6)